MKSLEPWCLAAWGCAHDIVPCSFRTESKHLTAWALIPRLADTAEKSLRWHSCLAFSSLLLELSKGVSNVSAASSPYSFTAPWVTSIRTQCNGQVRMMELLTLPASLFGITAIKHLTPFHCKSDVTHMESGMSRCKF